MGKTRSYEIIEYRKKIMAEICKSKELIKPLGCKNEQNPEDIIPFKWAFPHEYIPEAITRTEHFINFEISANIDSRNNVFKDLTIYFFVVCHQDVARYNDEGRQYLWYDKVVCELDTIFCNKNILGIGETNPVGNTPYCPQSVFKDRLLKFVVKDFNNGLRYGK